jgi:hypothetical protein
MANTTIPVELSSTPGIVDNSNATAITIDSSERVIVGNASPFTADSVTIDQGGFLAIRNTSASGMEVRRDSTDGSLIDFQKDGSPVGSIGGGTTFLTIGSGTGNVYFQNGVMAPTASSSGASSNGVVDLGAPSSRFKDLYLSSGVVFNVAGGSGTSTSGTLDDYEEGTWTPANGGNMTINTIYNATYTKIGRQVTLNMWVKANITSASGILGGLPFSVSGRTAAAMNNLTQLENFDNQALGTTIYFYGATTTGTDDDVLMSLTYNT